MSDDLVTLDSVADCRLYLAGYTDALKHHLDHGVYEERLETLKGMVEHAKDNPNMSDLQTGKLQGLVLAMNLMSGLVRVHGT